MDSEPISPPNQPTAQVGRVLGPAAKQPDDDRAYEIALVEVIAEAREGAPVELRPTGERIVATSVRPEAPTPGTVVIVRGGCFNF